MVACRYHKYINANLIVPQAPMIKLGKLSTIKIKVDAKYETFSMHQGKEGIMALKDACDKFDALKHRSRLESF